MALDNITPNDKLFEKILHQGMKDDTIHDVVLVEKKAALKKGENYLSILTRLTLHYIRNVPSENGYEKEDRVAHLILKEEPALSEDVLHNLREMSIFQTEYIILDSIVPSVEKLVGKRLSAKVYYGSNKPPAIIMEDLSILGFQNRNRQLGLSEEDVNLVLDSIADYHAGTVSLNEQNPGSTSRYVNGILSEYMPRGMEHVINNGIIAVTNIVSTWPEAQSKKMAEKLRKMASDFIERCRQCYELDEDEFLVLNHGDLWSNNIMFRDDDNGKVQEVRFVDFQVSTWMSPAIDLTYFLSVAPEYSIRASHDDIFVERYWNRLIQTMKKIGCLTKPPTLEQLKKSMYKRRAYYLMAGLCFYPKIVLEEENVQTLDEMLEGTEEDEANSVNNPIVIRALKKILPILDERGYLD